MKIHKEILKFFDNAIPILIEEDNDGDFFIHFNNNKVLKIHSYQGSKWMEVYEKEVRLNKIYEA